MTSAESCTVIPVEVLEEQEQIPPVGIGLEFFHGAVHRAATIFIAQKDVSKAAGKLSGDVPKTHLRSGARRKLEQKTPAGEEVKLLKRFDQKIIQGKPDRPAPVGIPAEQPGGRF